MSIFNFHWLVPQPIPSVERGVSNLTAMSAARSWPIYSHNSSFSFFCKQWKPFRSVVLLLIRCIYLILFLGVSSLSTSHLFHSLCFKCNYLTFSSTDSSTFIRTQVLEDKSHSMFWTMQNWAMKSLFDHIAVITAILCSFSAYFHHDFSQICYSKPS